jgi:hypothetical protein
VESQLTSFGNSFHVKDPQVSAAHVALGLRLSKLGVSVQLGVSVDLTGSCADS